MRKQGKTLKNRMNNDPKLKQMYRDILKKATRFLIKKQNHKEKQIENILNNILPNEYKYVGNNKVLIERFNPDFINCNGKKKIIELYGTYWHNLPNYKIRDKRRLKTYRKYGYDTLIIWENELEKQDELKQRILMFHNL